MQKREMPKNTVSVVGARGYSGLELVKLLLNHPCADLKYAYATSDFDLKTLLSHSAAKSITCMSDAYLFNHSTDFVFLATPAEVSLKLAPRLIAQGSRVIDLSGAFRLQTNDYHQWYKFVHHEATLLKEACYGLVPFVGPEVTKAKLISNPGCYATAISMAILPLLAKNIIEPTSLVIDAKSGSSGAGKKAAENLLFCEVDGECLPYKVGEHQHKPEIEEAAQRFANKAIDPMFSTSLLPVRRGIIAAIYATLQNGLTQQEVEQAFSEAYSDYPLVSFGAFKKHPELVQLRRVVGTARTHLSYEVKGNRLYLFSCIDNLMKGAASQAIENFNLLLDLPSSLGLEKLEAQI